MIRRLGLILAIVALVSGAGLLLRAEPPQTVGTWASIGNAPENRIGAAAVALADGRTLIVGGLANGTPTDAVVVFDPADSSFATAGQLLEPRAGHTATLLEDGRVLIAGGTVNDILTGDLEIFDPSDGSSALVATLAMLRSGHAAARIGDGKVLIAGGTGTDGVLQTAEIFDPETGSVSLTGSALNIARTGASATALIDGRVLIAGGNDGNQDLLSAEIYNPSTDSFQATDTNLDVPRSNHTAVLLPNNNSVLIAGGTSDGVPLATADLFLPAQFPDPFTYGMGQFALTGGMAAPRSGAAGGPHIEGYAFVVGGGQTDAEVYRFATIKTDKDDYAPGQRAIITGSGWEANEEVTLLFQEDPAVHPDYQLTVTADGDGNIYNDQWAPEEHDLWVRFYLLATGEQSRRQAQTTFTDGINLALNAPKGTGGGFVWYRGDFTLPASGTFRCDGAQQAANNCTGSSLTVSVHATDGVANTVDAVLSLTPTGPVSKTLSTGMGGANTPWSTSFVFKSTPGATEWELPGDGMYDVRAFLDADPVAATDQTVVNDDAFGVDNTPPVIVISGVTFPLATTVRVQGTGQDATSGAKGEKVSVVLNKVGGLSNPIASDSNVALTGNPKITWQTDFTKPTDPGDYCFVASMEDVAGNTATTSPATTGTHCFNVAATNTAPVAVDDAATVNEDSSNNVIDVLANDTDADNVSPTPPNTGLTVVAVGSASNGSASLLGGVVRYTPNADYCGPDSFTYTVSDDGTSSAGHTDQGAVSIDVTCINDVPSFTSGGDVTVAEDSGAYSQAWATDISAGPADESGQLLNFSVDNDNPLLFSLQPAVAPNGTLSFTPAPNANGAATVTVRIYDDGGTANEGVDTSADQTFTIDVTAVNDPPDAVDDSASVPEDDSTGVLVDVLANDTKGPANESGQTLTITFVSAPSHGTAVVESGQIRYKPTEANYFGPDSFTYTIRDNGQTNGVDDFMTDMATVNITVTPVNDAPANLSLNLSSGSINENTSTMLSGSFTDVETGDSHTVEINWGDGSAVTTVPLGAGVVAIPATSHTYLDDNPTGTTSDSYTITVTVTDNGQSGSPPANDFRNTSTTTSVTVNNVSPSMTTSSFTFDPYTGVANASVSFSDPGRLDTVSAAFDWAGTPGGGTPAVVGPAAASPLTGTFTGTQTFTGCVAGAIGVRVSDDDTGYFDHTFAPANTLGLYTAAFLAPIKDGVRNVVKHGNVIPVKVEIRDCHGNLVTDRILSIVLYAGVSSPADVVEGDMVIASSVSSADSGNTMRLADGHYMYNLATKLLTLGFPYTIWIKDGTMTVATAVITTKK